jgi:hypothetical protein
MGSRIARSFWWVANYLTNNGSFHWSKDFVEHLRTVHFALVLVASALIITGANTESARMSVALTQVQQIAKFERQWPAVPTKLYEQAMLDAGIDTHWTEGLAVVLPRDIYREREIDTFMSVPKNLIVAAEPWKFGGASLPAELSTLSEFRDFWNVLSNGITLVLPKAPDRSSSCDETVRIEHPDGSTDLLQEDVFELITPTNNPAQKCAVGAGLMSGIGGPQFNLKYELIALSEDILKFPDVDLWVTSDLPLEKASLARRKGTKALVSITVINLGALTVNIREDYLRRLFFNDWKMGKFESAFPELNSVSSGISTLEINDAVRRLESQVASSERNISLLGFTIPLTQLSRWGVLVLFSVQLYLWLHLHELANRIQPDAEGWDVAWIGVYRTRSARAVMVVTCLVLPVAAALTLALRIVSIAFYFHRTAVALSTFIVLMSSLLGFLTVWRLMKLRQNASGT